MSLVFGSYFLVIRAILGAADYDLLSGSLVLPFRNVGRF